MHAHDKECSTFSCLGGHRADSVKSNASAAAMSVNDASFSWRNSAEEEEEGGSGENRESGEDGEERRVKRTWTLTNVNLTVPRVSKSIITHGISVYIAIP